MTVEIPPSGDPVQIPGQDLPPPSTPAEAPPTAPPPEIDPPAPPESPDRSPSPDASEAKRIEPHGRAVGLVKRGLETRRPVGGDDRHEMNGRPGVWFRSQEKFPRHEIAPPPPGYGERISHLHWLKTVWGEMPGAPTTQTATRPRAGLQNSRD